MHRLRIGPKACLTTLLVAVPSLVIFSLLILGGTGDILRENVSRQIRQRGAKSVQNLEELIRHSRTNLLTIARTPALERLLTNLDRGGDLEPEVAALQEVFLGYQKLDPTLQAIRFIDTRGNELVKVREGRVMEARGDRTGAGELPVVQTIAERSFFQSTMELAPREVWISRLERGRVEGEEVWCPAMVRFSTPLFFADGGRAGILIINIWGDAVGKMINRLISPEEGTAFIIERNLQEPERNGIYLFHQDSTCEFGNQTGSRITIFQQYPSQITDAWMREDSGLLRHPETDDILAHFFYSPYGEQDRGWVVVINARKDFFLAPLSTIRTRILLSAGIVLLCIVAASLLSSRSLVRPIQTVIEGTRRLSQDLGYRIEVHSRDEVGFLGEAINRMAEGLQRNIEEKAGAEQQILHAEKLASVGEMAAGLAHELNTPLGNIRALATLSWQELEGGTSTPEALTQDLVAIREQTERCSCIITGLLGFARRQNPELSFHDVDGLLSKALDLVCRKGEAKGVALEHTPNPELPAVYVDSHQMIQVFVNLLLNAIDATQEGGRVSISGHAGDGQVRVQVADTGCGIAPEHLGKIFNPFFTTKEVGKGTGLGLSVSYGIVRNQGGHIDVSSELGKGTTFTVSLEVREV